MLAITEQTAQACIRCLQAEIVNVSDEQQCIAVLKHAQPCITLTIKEAQALSILLTRCEYQHGNEYSYEPCDEWAVFLAKKLEQVGRGVPKQNTLFS